MTSCVASRLATLMLIFSGVYLFELASFPLSIDEEMAAGRNNPEVWISQGRWGAYLIEKFVLPHPTIPVVPPAIFGACCAAAFLLVIASFRSTEKPLGLRDYAAFVIFCAFPTWFFIMEFYSNIAAIGLGLLSVSLSTWLLLGDCKIGKTQLFIFCVFLTTLAIGIYQSFLALALAMGTGAVFLRAWTSKDRIDLGRLIFLGIILVSALALATLIDTLCRLVHPDRSQYFDQLLQVHNFFDQPLRSIGVAVGAVLGIYGIDKSAYGELLLAIPLIIALGLGAIVCTRTLSSRDRILGSIGMLLVLLLPFSMHLFSPGGMPTRSLVAVPFVVWMLTHLGTTSELPWIRRIATAALVVAVFQIVVLQNRYQALNYFGARHDLYMAAAIHERISLSPGFDPTRTYPVVVLGSAETAFPRPPSSTIGASFFEWDGGNPYRIVHYMRLLGYTNISDPTEKQMRSSARRLAEMPIWPAAGSVQLIDGAILLRLGRTPNSTMQRMLEGAGGLTP